MSMPRRSKLNCSSGAPVRAEARIRTSRLGFAGVAALVAFSLVGMAEAMPVPPQTLSSTTAPTLGQVQQKMAGMAVPFEANEGQFAPEVAFAARTFAGTLFVTRDGKIVHALAGKPEQVKDAKQPKQKKETQQNDEIVAADHTPSNRIGKDLTLRGPGWVLVETLQGAGPLTPTGTKASATNVSRFTGGVAPDQTSSIATFDRVTLGHPWPGVSVELAARGSNVEKLFTVAPGSNPKSIHMSVAGAKRLHLDENGSLIATTGNGDVAITSPVAFQDIGGKRSIVPVRYKLLADNSYHFETGGYDHSQPLVIDPLLQSTYLGGSGQDQAFALAIDAGGNVLIAGYTGSTDFPGTAGGAQPANGGNGDAFVARLSSNLTALVQATYLGGSGDDRAYALAIDASGNVFITGVTQSTNFPGTTGGAQPVKGASDDAFVARLSSNLTMLLQATYLGGSSADNGFALALDAGGNVLVAGATSSTNFPGTSGGAQPTIGGFGDAFVARLSNNLGTLVKATYLGGNFDDAAYALALDASGNVFIAGQTQSTTFPGTTGGAQPANGGSLDAFVARLSSNLTMLVQATYVGGSSVDTASGLVLDAGGNAFVAGFTISTNFPGTIGGAQPASGGSSDAFIARLSSSLTTLVQATYLGGGGGDQAGALALYPGGNVLVAGSTDSTNFPGTTGGAQPASGGGSDAFIARLSVNLTSLVQTTYLGGSGGDAPNALALDAGSNVLVAGLTSSTNFPGTTGGAQPTNGGSNGAFVAKFTGDLRLSSDAIFANGFE